MNAKLKAVLGYLPFVGFGLAGHLGGPDLVGWFALDAATATGVIMLTAGVRRSTRSRSRPSSC